MITAVEDAFLPLGVTPAGQPLPSLMEASVDVAVGGEPASTPEAIAHAERSSPAGVAFAVTGEVDAGDLTQAGWGVMFAPGVDSKIKEALQPLIDHRRAQGAAPLVVYDGPQSFRAGDTATAWLERQGVRMDVVDPSKGVPFYLVIVGSPETIPFTFQYSLDLYWAVGRLWFDTPDEFRRYAESVIAYERAAQVPTARQMAIFAPQHDFDAATQLFNRLVVAPLIQGEGERPIPIGQRQKFGVQNVTADAASKTALADIFGGRVKGGKPALLFSGGHGMAFGMDDARQAARQGALVCQDWPAFGAITEDHWFSGDDLVSAQADVRGLVHFMFACYGGGCPSHDEFDRANATPKQIAPRPMLSRLPQALLAHENGGALAVLAHVERAWAYSFQNGKGSGQVQGFRDVIGRLLRGERIGQATDTFNLRWSVLSTTLADLQAEKQNGVDVPWTTLGRLWIARDDARNFLVIGDPAVRLRVEDMPPPS